MPPFYRIAEVALYSLLNFLPFMILAMFPFRKKFRFSKTKTNILIILVSVIQIVLGMVATFGGSSRGFLSTISTLIYAAFYFLAVKAHFGKTLFTLLMLSNITNLVVTTSKSLEGLIFGDIAYESYRWTFSLCMFGVELLFLIPLFFYIKSTYMDMFEKDSVKETWRFLWLIPATFYLVWYYHLYGSHLSSLEIALQPNRALILLIINLGALLIYHMLIKLIRVMDSHEELMLQNYQLATQSHQYENLQERINEARHAKHDIRHHITLMDDLLAKGEYDRLKDYLQGYKKSLPDDSSIILCSHYATNALLLYFAQQAKNQNVDYKVSVSLPKDINIPDSVLSVVLGNLLENALEACATDISEKKKISIKGKYEAYSGSLFFQVDNTYSGEYILDKKGLYMSTKHSGRGLGLSSVRDIVAKYQGMIEITPREEIFSVSVLLMVPTE